MAIINIPVGGVAVGGDGGGGVVLPAATLAR